MTTSNDGNITGQGQSPEELKVEAGNQAARISEQARQQAKRQFNQGRETVSSGMDKVAHAVRAAASDLQEQNSTGLSGYVTDIAESMSSLAESLRGKNIDELMQEVGGIAKRNPALFVTGSVAIGFGLARFAKSSSTSSQESSANLTDQNINSDYGTRYESASYEGAGYENEGYQDEGYEKMGYVSDSRSDLDIDMDMESGTDSTWTNDYTGSSGDSDEAAEADESFTAGDYSDRDFASPDSPSPDFSSSDKLSSDSPPKDKKNRNQQYSVRPDDKGKANDLGGHRYE